MDNINFLDLIALTRIKPETSVEKFGSEINSSFFDSSNILGTLKQKGLIDFTVNFPEQNKIIITDIGKKLIDDANSKAETEFDLLDLEILKQLSVAKRHLTDLSSTLNIISSDLALRLYKLLKQNFISYTIHNANIELMLTESGFMKIKSSQQQAATEIKPEPIENTQLANNILNNTKNNSNNNSNKIYAEFEQKLQKTELINKKIILIAIIVIALIVVLFILFKINILNKI